MLLNNQNCRLDLYRNEIFEKNNRKISRSRYGSAHNGLLEELTRILHELHTPSLVSCFHKGFVSVRGMNNHTASSKNPL